jgi:RNA ligase (TIGR02306 family)
MRKLASIQQIIDIQPIPNADAIEVVTINGWKVVSKKGEFKIGDRCIYFEIDSFLPIKPEFEFLRKSCYRKLVDGSEGFRLRTVKLRGQVSQGLALPLPMFGDFESLELGSDLSEYLRVIKYDPPMPAELNGIAKGNFPSFIQKTDQERIQNLWSEYKEKYNDVEFEVTLKLDGTSCTFYHNNGEVGVCSRNLELQLNPDNTHGKIEAKHNIFEKLKKSGRNIALQGEIIGEGIQGNPEKIFGQCFMLFDIWDIDKDHYLTADERVRLLNELEIEEDIHIYITHFKKLSEFNSLDEILKFAEGKSLKAEIREGLVFKSKERINGKIISFKAISNQFLLNEK